LPTELENQEIIQPSVLPTDLENQETLQSSVLPIELENQETFQSGFGNTLDWNVYWFSN
jgi:hypothetical protein